MVAALPLLAGSSGVQRRGSWTSAATSPQVPSLGLNLLGYTDSAIPSVWTDRRYIYSLFYFSLLSAKMIIDAFVEAADSLLQDFKNKPEIL